MWTTYKEMMERKTKNKTFYVLWEIDNIKFPKPQLLTV